MKTFEERYTAWVDGQLAGPELSQFESELPDREAAERDRANLLRLSRTLQTFGAAPALTNAEFFSHQLLERIGAETKPAAETPSRRSFFFSLPQLAWAGACCFFLAFGLYFALIPPRPGAAGFANVSGNGTGEKLPITAVHRAPGGGSGSEMVYDASIIEATPQEPGISATSIHSKSEDMTVLWLDGLDYLPASYQLQ